MNAAVRAVTRMGIYVGAKVFLIYEVRLGRVQVPRRWALCWGWGAGGCRGDTCPVPQLSVVQLGSGPEGGDDDVAVGQ